MKRYLTYVGPAIQRLTQLDAARVMTEMSLTPGVIGGHTVSSGLRRGF